MNLSESQLTLIIVVLIHKCRFLFSATESSLAAEALTTDIVIIMQFLCDKLDAFHK